MDKPISKRVMLIHVLEVVDTLCAILAVVVCGSLDINSEPAILFMLGGELLTSFLGKLADYLYCSWASQPKRVIISGPDMKNNNGLSCVLPVIRA